MSPRSSIPASPSSPDRTTAGRCSPSLTYAQVLAKPASSNYDGALVTTVCTTLRSPGEISECHDRAMENCSSTLTRDIAPVLICELSNNLPPQITRLGIDDQLVTQAPAEYTRDDVTPTNGDEELNSATQPDPIESDLGKHMRMESPTPSPIAASPPMFSKIPKKTPRGKKAARVSPPSPIQVNLAHESLPPHPETNSSLPSTPPGRSHQIPVSIEAGPSTYHWGEERALRNRGTSPADSSDVSMRTASPLNHGWQEDRIPLHAKGKEPLRQPSPKPSRPHNPFGTFLDREQDPIPTQRLRPPAPPSYFCPNDSTYSVYPPIPSPFIGTSPPSSPSPQTRHTINNNDPFTYYRDDESSQFPARRRNTSPSPHNQPTPAYEDRQLPFRSHTEHVSNLVQFVKQTEEHAPAEHDDFLTFTPVPPGGFPKLHVSTPLGLFDNIDETQLLDWEKERAKGRVVVGTSFYGHGALDGEVDPRFRQLISYAAHLLNARFHTNRIMIATPRPRKPVTTLNSSPFTALIYGVTQEEADILLGDEVMATPRLGLFFHRLDILFPSYIGAIHGLTTRLIHPIYELVVEHFLSDEAATLFRDLTAAAPNSTILPENAQIHFINTLHVRRLDCRARGNTLTPVFLIYIDSPAFDYLSHRTWTSYCRTINLSHSLYGSGHLQSPGTCAGCHGHDHPTGLCRLPQVAKWCAPAPFSTPNFAIPTFSSSSSSSAPAMLVRQQNTRAPRGGTADRGRRRRGTRRNAP